MPTSVVALEILLILLPGFAAAYIVQVLALRGSQTDLDKVTEAALYSFIIYSTFVLLSRGSMPFEVLAGKPPATDTLIIWRTGKLLLLVVLTIMLAFAGTVYVNLDGNLLFRKLRITERTARRSIWNDVFQREATRSQVVQVELADKRSIIGVLSYYSDAAEDCSLYLAQASWVDEENNLIPIPGPGILLTKNSNIQSVSLLKSDAATSPPPTPAPAS